MTTVTNLTNLNLPTTTNLGRSYAQSSADALDNSIKKAMETRSDLVKQRTALDSKIDDLNATIDTLGEAVRQLRERK